MARSVSLHPEHKETAELALERNGFLTRGDLAANLDLCLSTVSNFFNCKNVHISTYEKICEALNLDKRAILQPIADSQSASIAFSAYNPQTFTGREAEIEQFTTLLSGSCRILAITGMTGIGKTALAERVVANLMESPKSSTLPYIRFSLDDRSLSPDFSISGAALLRTLGEEPTLADQQDAANLLAHILKRLCSNPCRLQIDSLERLLKGNEQEGWSEFCDPLWLDLLHQFVAGNDCPSQLLLTSQDVTGDLDAVASRYSEFYRCQTLRGLNSDEQRDFFQKLGLLADSDSTVIDFDYLNRIGAFYDGHPLVLQVIADEILQPPFQGNVALYCIKIAQTIDDRKGECRAYGNLGLAYSGMKEYDQAIFYHHQCLSISQHIGDSYSKGIALENLGGIMLEQGKYPQAIELLKKALKIDREIGACSEEAETLKKLAELHQALGELEVAQQFCQQALALATELGIPLVAECQILMKSLDREVEEAKVVQEEIS